MSHLPNSAIWRIKFKFRCSMHWMALLYFYDRRISYPSFVQLAPGVLSDEGPTLETLDFTIRISSTPTFLYFDFYPNTAYAVYYVDISFIISFSGVLCDKGLTLETLDFTIRISSVSLTSLITSLIISVNQCL